MTIIQDAKNGIIPEIAQIAKIEGLEPEKLRNKLLAGHVVIPHNPIHKPKPTGIGNGLRVKINVNLGDC